MGGIDLANQLRQVLSRWFLRSKFIGLPELSLFDEIVEIQSIAMRQQDPT